MPQIHQHHHQQQQQQQLQLQLQDQQQQQHSLHLERRIIELLTGTNLTFKEIITKLDSENLSASIGIIRRINRDNRYRRPRYDSKLTPAQRESLVEELRDHNGMKPNLSLLAKRYGVCHGSVWYWWDKLNRIKRGSSGASCKLSASRDMFRVAYGKNRARNKQIGGRRVLTSSGVNQFDLGATRGGSGVLGVEVGEGEEEDIHDHCNLAAYGQVRRRGHYQNAGRFLLDADKYNYVGRVSVVPRDRGEPIDLPILMFSRRELLEMNSVKTSPSSMASSLELSSSPSPLVVVDDEEEEEEEEVGDEFGSILGSSSSSSSAVSSPLLGGGSTCDDDQEAMQLDLTMGVGVCERSTVGARESA